MPLLSRRLMLIGAAALSASAVKADPTPGEPREYLDTQLVKPPPRPAEKQKPAWGAAYSKRELDECQRACGFRFPPDLEAFYRTRRPLRTFDWVNDHPRIQRAMTANFTGIVFDVENNHLWWPEWGSKPSTPEARPRRVREVFDAAPKLIPIATGGIPETPHEAGNPVFDVVQTDIIYSGSNLKESFDCWYEGPCDVRSTLKPKVIPFWTEMVEREQFSTREEAEENHRLSEEAWRRLDKAVGSKP